MRSVRRISIFSGGNMPNRHFTMNGLFSKPAHLSSEKSKKLNHWLEPCDGFPQRNFHSGARTEQFPGSSVLREKSASLFGRKVSSKRASPNTAFSSSPIRKQCTSSTSKHCDS